MPDIETVTRNSKRVREQEQTETLTARISKLRSEVDEAIEKYGGGHCE